MSVGEHQRLELKFEAKKAKVHNIRFDFTSKWKSKQIKVDCNWILVVLSGGTEPRRYGF